MLGVQLVRDGFRIAAISLRGEIIEQRDELSDPGHVVDDIVLAAQKIVAGLHRTVLALDKIPKDVQHADHVQAGPAPEPP